MRSVEDDWLPQKSVSSVRNQFLFNLLNTGIGQSWDTMSGLAAEICFFIMSRISIRIPHQPSAEYDDIYKAARSDGHTVKRWPDIMGSGDETSHFAHLEATVTSRDIFSGWACHRLTCLLKGPALDPSVLKHFRPVLKLLCISEILEKVLKQLCFGNNIFKRATWVFRSCTETALLNCWLLLCIGPSWSYCSLWHHWSGHDHYLK